MVMMNARETLKTIKKCWYESGSITFLQKVVDGRIGKNKTTMSNALKIWIYRRVTPTTKEIDGVLIFDFLYKRLPRSKREKERAEEWTMKLQFVPTFFRKKVSRYLCFLCLAENYDYYQSCYDKKIYITFEFEYMSLNGKTHLKRDIDINKKYLVFNHNKKYPYGISIKKRYIEDYLTDGNNKNLPIK